MAAQPIVKLRRLRHMGLAEIAGRGRQRARRWWDRVVTNAVPRHPDAAAGEGDERLAWLRGSAAERFFAGTVDDRAPAALAARMPDAARTAIAGAEQSLRGRFDLLGYRDLSFGEPIDWHLDPVAQKRAPFVHASRVHPLDPASVGDSKVVWELNRHQWMVELAQTYRLTGDERYAEAFAARIAAWLEANPPGWGINWASSLEAALRLMAWSWALVLFRRSPALRPAVFNQAYGALREHALHVERYLSHYFSPNTHLTGEALGLFYAGTVFPELDGSRRWRDRGAEILARHLERQVLRDGVYFEQSTCYQRYTVEIALHFMILSARNAFPISASVGEAAQKMLDFLLAIRLPRGDAPQIGDADGGWLMPLTRRAAGDLRGVFAPAAALFGRADYAWAAGGAQPELLWLLGPAGLAAFDSLAASLPAAPPSRVFADGGYAVMRDGWDGEGHHLVFDVGPLGCPLSGGHGHADLLAIECSAFGEPFLVDAGTGSYAEETWRRFFRSTAAHSSVVVDGASQAVPAGPFAWEQRPRARLRRWLSTDAFDFADAEHDAYGRLPDPVRHRRRVLFVKPRYWVLVDDVDATGTHAVEVRFQFAPVEMSLEGGWARAVTRGRGLLLRAFSTARLESRLRTGSFEPVEGWLSPDYGRREPAPVLVYASLGLLPIRIVTLLMPVADPASPPPAVVPLSRGGELAGVVFESTGETVSIESFVP